MATDSQSPVNNDFPLGPDSQKQPGVPEGKTFEFVFGQSKFFSGTTRDITVYVPAQYKAEKPACVYVGLDTLNFNVTEVFDNLIHRGEMPVTLAIGISPGKVASLREEENPRFNRSFEFDGLNDALARFLVEELFPEVEKMQTPDGLPILLSKDPNDRCAGGLSTGGVGSFTLAWERPDLFRRVFTGIGTFVGMRGADCYPILVRKTEPKPIRIFQQDGEHDVSYEMGDWWMGNLVMNGALEFAGYEHQHVWGTGSHNGNHATAVFPDAMRFLWKDWPEPIRAQTAKTQGILRLVLDLEATWELVSEAGTACEHPVANPQGEVFFHDTAAKRTRKIGLDSQISDAPAIPADQAFGFAAEGSAVTAGGIRATCLTVTGEGFVYATDAEAGKVWLLKPDGQKLLLDEGLKQPSGIALTPDGLWLAVMESETHRGYSYRVLADGAVEFKQAFYWVHVPDWADNSGAGGMCMDREGYAYVATHLGVQVLDRNGRTRGIIPMPAGRATGVCFGGANFDQLFVTSGGQLYRRRMQAVGEPSFLAPIQLAPWKAT